MPVPAPDMQSGALGGVALRLDISPCGARLCLRALTRLGDLDRLRSAHAAVAAPGDAIHTYLRTDVGVVPEARQSGHDHMPILSEPGDAMPRCENASMGSGDQRVRLDKWLWAARFFKTRGLATEAVQGGRVHLNDQRVKPARDVRMGDVVQVTRPGSPPLTAVIRGISDRRGPATEARLLYEETPESVAAREEDRLMRTMAPPPPGADLSGRPTKRDRRRYDDARRRSG